MSTHRPDVGEPDAFMLAEHARQVRRMRVRRRTTLSSAALTVAVAVAVWTGTDLSWLWILLSALSVLLVLACASHLGPQDSERPVPDTPVEAAVVVGVEIISWGRADRDGFHDVRVIARPIGSDTGQLVYGHLRFHADRGCRITAGMLVGFRRHPTMRYLVHVEPHHDPLALLALRDAAEGVVPDRGGADAAVTGVVEEATVESVVIGDRPDGDRWATTVTLRAADGALLTDSRPRLPEELGGFEPGRRVPVVRGGHAHLAGRTRCAVLPRTP
ncbi:hypothetical protein [Streptomyces sp. rh34]|uniref:hypothetical protein n=1 Tax=Streptomyces sp. rh34 TaxID=2034272 RepID=UPI000BEF89A2|nr:hypothetical protein [Streptomyces sp. rh34]